MKDTRWDDHLSGSRCVNSGSSAPQPLDESLFSLLLKMESRFRAGAEEDARVGHCERKSSKMKISKRSKFSHLSRYIE